MKNSDPAAWTARLVSHSATILWDHIFDFWPGGGVCCVTKSSAIRGQLSTSYRCCCCCRLICCCYCYDGGARWRPRASSCPRRPSSRWGRWRRSPWRPPAPAGSSSGLKQGITMSQESRGENWMKPHDKMHWNEVPGILAKKSLGSNVAVIAITWHVLYFMKDLRMDIRL